MGASVIIESAPIGSTLAVHLNGRPLGIVESDPEFAFSYWGQRQARKDKRTYTLTRNGVIYHFINGHWRAV